MYFIIFACFAVLIVGVSAAVFTGLGLMENPLDKLLEKPAKILLNIIYKHIKD